MFEKGFPPCAVQLRLFTQTIVHNCIYVLGSFLLRWIKPEKWFEFYGNLIFQTKLRYRIKCKNLAGKRKTK